MLSSGPAESILEETLDLRSELLAHPLYELVDCAAAVQVFMANHVFAVWDFMALLKRLQSDLCGVAVPWLPPRDPETARFVNEIVLGEESDEAPGGSFCSHFELYLEAMTEVGAPRAAIDELIRNLGNGDSVDEALQGLDINDRVREFSAHNCRLAKEGRVHEVAAAFCFGREDIIPDMFQRLLDGFQANQLHVPRLRYYVERHIELDGDHHGPMSQRLIDSVIGNDETKLAEATTAAREALKLRIGLWDGILSVLGNTNTNAKAPHFVRHQNVPKRVDG